MSTDRTKPYRQASEAALTLNHRQTAELLGIRRTALYDVINAGGLRPIQIPGLRWPRYRRSDVEALVERRSP